MVCCLQFVPNLEGRKLKLCFVVLLNQLPAYGIWCTLAEEGRGLLTSFISPYIADRKIARDLHTSASQGGDDAIPFIEVFVDIPVEVAEKRDPKGLYKKARAGEIPNFTGISAPYEKPENPEIHIKTDELSIEECVVRIVEYLQAQKLLP